MKWSIFIFIVVFLLWVSACSPQTIPTPTTNPQLTHTPQLTLTPTQMPPFTGKLFFDMNGSGLQDDSSFIYDSERLADSRQPLQPDLDKAIKDYLVSHPDLNEGDLVTIPEPGLSGYQVCIEKECTTTSQDGSFEISNGKGRETAFLKIIDPNKDVPALAMRYINEWKRAIVIVAYEINGVQVPEQQLNDTSIFPLESGIIISLGKGYDVGLMQGFLTSPFMAKDLSNIYIWGYFDDANNYITCGKPAKINGVAISYDGKYTKDGGGDPIHPSVGVGDAHGGYDFSSPIGTIIINTGSYGEVWLLPEDNELRLITNFPIGEEHFQNCFGHLLAQLVGLEPVYRGQIIGVSDHTGDSPYHQLHFDLTKSVKVDSKNCNQYLDPFRSTIKEPFPLDFSGSDVSYWTVDNLPQFLCWR